MFAYYAYKWLCVRIKFDLLCTCNIIIATKNLYILYKPNNYLYHELHYNICNSAVDVLVLSMCMYFVCALTLCVCMCCDRYCL